MNEIKKGYVSYAHSSYHMLDSVCPAIRLKAALYPGFLAEGV